MRPFMASLPKFVLAIASLVLLGAGLALHLAGPAKTSAASYESRDAFAARIERGEQSLSTATIAKEWRSEIAAQRVTAQRDSILAPVLLAMGVLTLIASVASLRGTTAAQPGPAMTASDVSPLPGGR
jgi:hypothetical protein